MNYGSQTDLLHDNENMRYEAARAKFPMQYVFNTPQPTAGPRAIQGRPTVGYGVDVAAYHQTMSRATRKPKSQNSNLHELYGTAPLLAKGDGVMLNPQVENDLRFNQIFLNGSRSRHLLSERPQPQLNYNTKPLVMQTPAQQGGVSTRDDLPYV